MHYTTIKSAGTTLKVSSPVSNCLQPNHWLLKNRPIQGSCLKLTKLGYPLLACLALLAPECEATTYQVDYSGTVASHNSGFDSGLATLFPIGSTLSVSYTFEDTTSNSSVNPDTGIYEGSLISYTQTIVSPDVSVGTISMTKTAGRIVIGNALFGSVDRYSVQPSGLAVEEAPVPTTSFSLTASAITMDDPTKTAFSDTNLPSFGPDPASFGNTAHVGIYFGDSKLLGHFTSVTTTVVPEPLVAEVRTAVEFTFTSVIGHVYSIEDSIDSANWENVESGIAGTGELIQRFYSTRNMPRRFFHVVDETP